MEEIELVSNTVIEEVLQDIGILGFGDGMSAKANVAISGWSSNLSVSVCSPL